MRSATPVLGLTRWNGKNFGQEVDVEVEQKRAMKKEATPFSALGIAGKLLVADRQVCQTPALDLRPRGICEGLAKLLHDECVGIGNGLAHGFVQNWQDQGVVQATGPLEHGSTAGASSQDG